LRGNAARAADQAALHEWFHQWGAVDAQQNLPAPPANSDAQKIGDAVQAAYEYDLNGTGAKCGGPC